MGSYASNEISANKIPEFKQKFNINMNDFEDKKYITFNEFFSRPLKPGARPMTPMWPNERLNNNIVISPADCRLTVFKTIKDAQKVWIKGREFSVGSLFSKYYSRLARHFKGGSIAICRLAPQDYHRWHMPVRGLQTHHLGVKGDLFSVNPKAVQERELNVFGENKRQIAMFKTHEYGKVAMIIVGATLVGSIVVTGKNQRINYRGEEHGYFQFGGSTIILLFEKGRVEFDPDLLKNSKHEGVETYVQTRTRIGMAKKPGYDADVQKALRREVLLRQKEAVQKQRKKLRRDDNPNMADWKPFQYDHAKPAIKPSDMDSLQSCCIIS